MILMVDLLQSQSGGKTGGNFFRRVTWWSAGLHLIIQIWLSDVVIGSSLPKRFMATSNSAPFLNETADRILEIWAWHRLLHRLCCTMLFFWNDDQTLKWWKIALQFRHVNWFDIHIIPVLCNCHDHYGISAFGPASRGQTGNGKKHLPHHSDIHVARKKNRVILDPELHTWWVGGGSSAIWPNFFGPGFPTIDGNGSARGFPKSIHTMAKRLRSTRPCCLATGGGNGWWEVGLFGKATFWLRFFGAESLCWCFRIFPQCCHCRFSFE